MDLNRALTHTCFDRDANLEKALAAQRALVQAQEVHNEKLEQQVALLKEEEDKLRKDKKSEERDVKTQNLYMADNARLNAQMRLQMKAEKQQEDLANEQPDATRGGSELKPNARPLSLQGKGETNSASTAMQLASFAQGRDVEIPKAVLEKADAIVKHKVTTELAKRYESEINSDTSFIFSGPKSDEMLSDANRATDASMITAPALLQQLAGTNRAPATAEGFGDIHDMERAVLTQLIQSNSEREQAAANKIAQAKAAAAEKQAAAAHALAVKKKLHLEAAQKIAQAKAATLANDRALKAAAAAAAAKKYAAEHKPLNKMSAQQRALAFVRAFDEVGAHTHTHTHSTRLGDTYTDTDASGDFATKLSVGDEGGDSSAEWARNRLVAAGVANDGTSNL